MFFIFSTVGTGWSETAGRKPAQKIRIGTYDSRAVAVAYAGSEHFSNWLKNLKADHARAKANGDTVLAARLEATGADRQKRMHRQAFSTASVDDIMEEIQEKLPAIRAEAGVDVLVSKWDKETLRDYPNAQEVDVTMALIDALAPTDRQRKYAIDIQKKNPIPLEQAKNFRD
jgi:hypothetical protein